MKWAIRAIAVASLLTVALPGLAASAGQNVTIQYGIVKTSRQVDLRSGAVPAGAVVGGGLGLVSGSGKSSGKKARNAIIGTIAGGAIAGAAQGTQKGMLYNIDLSPSGTMEVVSDQREIRNGDCVAVEKAGQTANVRRVSLDYCQPANAAAIAAVADEAREEAAECAAVKQQLVDASTPDEADLAIRKVSLLCND